mmetsp:Transcript_34189/g.33387  ORF Transcript_34189/g.33387 Transcript_34189/m.33387 type:complete len:203 (+) Transcript_34189:1807-2415(+)
MNDLKDKVLQKIEGSQIQSNGMSLKEGLNFILPFDKQGEYHLLFQELEADPHVTSFHVNLTNLEDAFINFTKLKNEERDEELDISILRKSEGKITYSKQVKGVFLKRWFNFKRDWRMWTLLLLPSIIISIIILYTLTSFSFEQTKTSKNASFVPVDSKKKEETTLPNITEMFNFTETLNLANSSGQINITEEELVETLTTMV